MHPVIETDRRAIVFDLSVGSDALGENLRDLDVARFSALIEARLAAAGTGFGYGRWGERREIYAGDLFATDDSGERRDVHLGVDVFCAAGTDVYCPLPGRVHAVENNARAFDYGPVVIIEHADPAVGFSLYGHLADDCLSALTPGQHVATGERIASVGAPPGNGNWPPHLHFQWIRDLKGLGTQFPGVARASEVAHWFDVSPLPSSFFPGIDPARLDGREPAIRNRT